MVHRVTVTVPDELGERLKVVKDRFNVSRVCQEALATEVTKQEFLMKEPKDMEQIVARLRSEKQAFIKSMADMGREHGREDATRMEYSDLCEVERIANGEGDIAKHITTSPLWENWLGEEVHDVKTEQGTFDVEAYLEGWVEGVTEFWTKIKYKI